MLTRDSGGPRAASSSLAVAPTLTAAISSTEGSLTTGATTIGVIGAWLISAEPSGSGAAANSRLRAARRAEAEADRAVAEPLPDPADSPDPLDSRGGAGAKAGALVMTSAFGSTGLTTFAPGALEVMVSTPPKILPT